MPVTPYAKLLVSVNAAPPVSGAITVANGDVIQLSGENTAGWRTRRYEIYSFYSASEFPLPSGWTDDGNGTYSYSLGDIPPPFTIPSLPAWGKWLPRLTVNGGLNGDGANDPTLVDESTGLSVPGPGGLLDLAHLEGQQFSTLKKWVADMQTNLRFLDQLIDANLSPTFAGAGVLSTVNAGDAAVAGVSSTIPHGDHQHPVATASVGAIAIGDAAAEGVSTSLARADHIHSVAAPAAPANVTKTAASAGVAATFARADHKHDITTAAAGTIAVGDAAAEGSATSLARSDHVHALTTPAAPVNVTKDAASAGVATTVARSDHKHDITTAAASTIGTSNTEGSATSLARSDHGHDHGNLAGGSTHAVAVAGVSAGYISAANQSKLDNIIESAGAHNFVHGCASIQLSGDSFPPHGYRDSAATSAEIKWTVDNPIKVSGIRYRARVGGSGAATIDIVLRQGGVDTALTLNVASTALTGSASVTPFGFAADDDVSIRITPTALLETSPTDIQITIGCTSG